MKNKSEEDIKEWCQNAANESHNGLQHLTKLYISSMHPPSTVKELNSQPKTWNEFKNKNKLLENFNLPNSGRHTRSSHERQNSVFNLPGMHVIPRLLEVSDQMLRASAAQQKEHTKTEQEQSNPFKTDIKSLGATLGIENVKNFQEAYSPYAVFSGLNGTDGITENKKKHKKDNDSDQTKKRKKNQSTSFSENEDRLIALGKYRSNSSIVECKFSLQ
jgi:hypothetical protein